MSVEFKKELSSMSIADLYALFNFISIDYHKQFGVKTDIRVLVKSRYDAVLEELNLRAYGKNPYVEVNATYEGDRPEGIDLSKFEEGK
jgi:hypothetical protein